MPEGKKILTLDETLRRRTGYRPGDIPVTCPNCSETVQARFCDGCGHEVTSVNFEVLSKAISGGDLSHDELMEAMRAQGTFGKNDEVVKRVFGDIRENRIIFDG